MSADLSPNKRLAKNTILLYMRTFLIMIISLFTSRVILNTLGVVDYGINNVVGGFVSLFSIISGTLVATTQRFITFELGKREDSNPHKIFCIAMGIHIMLAIVILILFETIGLWFLNCKLNVPADRLNAANWVFQFSVATFIVNIVSAPYTSVIVAHEKMSAFAYISLLDVILKLIAVYALYINPFDKLVIYSFLLFCVAINVRLIYSIYCRRNFEETKFKLILDKNKYKEMFGFAGMNFLGAFASILANQGMDIILNIFFGVTINAARGIANQVLSAISKFVNDFMTALDPQITKEYSSGNKLRSQELCFLGARFAYFLMLILSIPIIFKTPFILRIWLITFPDYAIIFVRFSLILALFTVLSKPLVTEILATGNLKITVLWIGSSVLMALPIAFLFFKSGFGPEYAYITLIIVEIVSLLIRLIILNKITGIPYVSKFFSCVIWRILIVTFLLFLFNRLISNNLNETISGFLVYILLSLLVGLVTIIIIGINKSEKKAFFIYIKKIIDNVKQNN